MKGSFDPVTTFCTSRLKSLLFEALTDECLEWIDIIDIANAFCSVLRRICAFTKLLLTVFPSNLLSQNELHAVTTRRTPPGPHTPTSANFQSSIGLRAVIFTLGDRIVTSDVVFPRAAQAQF